MTGFNGQTTSYTYNTTSGVLRPHPNALTSITFPGGTHQYFTYDSEGRLAGTSNDGGAQPQSFAYALGEVSVTDGTGDTSQLYYNEQGLVVKSIDPLGNVTLNTYDGNFNLTSVTNALGQSETYTYNAAGEVTSSTDFLGNTTNFTYSGPFNDLSSMTDANGNTTNYAYSSAGDLLSTTYANGTSSIVHLQSRGRSHVVPQRQRPADRLHLQRRRARSRPRPSPTAPQYTYTYDSLRQHAHRHRRDRHDHVHLRSHDRTAHRGRLSQRHVPQIHLQRRRPADQHGGPDRIHGELRLRLRRPALRS